MTYKSPRGKRPAIADGGFDHDALVALQRVAYWKFVTGALFFSACSLLPNLLMN